MQISKDAIFDINNPPWDIDTQRYDLSTVSYERMIFTKNIFYFEDVESYVKYAKELGFKNIILAGHSLGSNKIIDYLGNTSDNFVNYFIVTAPVDLGYWWKVMPDLDKCLETAKKLVQEGKNTEILPYLFGGFSPIAAETVLNFYNATHLKNCPVLSGEGSTKSLSSIKINGSFIIGGKDSMADGDPKEFMSKINSYCKYSEKNNIIVIPDASHVFYNKHIEYASAILECVEKYITDTKNNTLKSLLINESA